MRTSNNRLSSILLLLPPVAAVVSFPKRINDSRAWNIDPLIQPIHIRTGSAYESAGKRWGQCKELGVVQFFSSEKQRGFISGLLLSTPFQSKLLSIFIFLLLTPTSSYEMIVWPSLSLTHRYIWAQWIPGTYKEKDTYSFAPLYFPFD